MATLDDVAASAREAAQAYADTVKQETQDAMLDQVLDLQGQVLDLTTALASVQAEFDAYRDSHPDPTLYGANFGSNPDTSRYPADVPVARLYLKGGELRSDIKADTGFSRAYAAGVRRFIISWKTGSLALLGTMLDSLPADVRREDVVVVYWHEPEDNIEDGSLSLAAWKAGVASSAEVARAKGCKAGTILMSFTLFTARRNPDDYLLEPGTVDYTGFDLYPQQRAVTMGENLMRMAAHAEKQGIPDLLIGEFGVDGSLANAVSLIEEFKEQFPTAGGKLACYWSQDPNRLTDATASAWFEV